MASLEAVVSKFLDFDKLLCFFEGLPVEFVTA